MVLVLTAGAQAVKARWKRMQAVQFTSMHATELQFAKKRQARAAVATEARLVFGKQEKRGRARVNAGVASVDELGGVARLEERRRSLMAKKDGRRSKAVHAVAPGGTMKLHEAPDRGVYAPGSAGTAAYEADMIEFLSGNIIFK